MKNLIKELKKKYDNIDYNIFRSVEDVNLDTIISYHKGKEKHHFLDNYQYYCKIFIKKTIICVFTIILKNDINNLSKKERNEF